MEVSSQHRMPRNLFSCQLLGFVTLYPTYGFKGCRCAHLQNIKVAGVQMCKFDGVPVCACAAQNSVPADSRYPSSIGFPFI